MFISSMWDVKEPAHYSKRAGHEVPGVVAVLCKCMGGYREGDMPRMGLKVRLHDREKMARIRQKLKRFQ